MIDTSGIPVCTAPGGKYVPSVSWDGANFFAIWEDSRHDDYCIFGSRITPDGEVLDPDGMELAHGLGYNQSWPASASDGTNVMAVWELQLYADNWDICGIRLDSAGSVWGDTFIVSIGSNAQNNGSVGWDGENFMVIWEDLRSGQFSDLYGIRINPAGEILDPAAFPICKLPEREYNPQLAWDGENFLVVWQDRRNADFDIYGTLVSPEGAVSDTDGFGIAITSGQPGNELNEQRPALAWSGESFLVVWLWSLPLSSAEVQGRRVGADGNPIGSTFDVSSTVYCGVPDIAWGETNYLVVYEGAWYLGSYDIYGQRINKDGTLIGDSILIYRDNYEQTSPLVTWGAGNYLVVWRDGRNGLDDIYGSRVSSQGAVLDPGGIPFFIGEGIQTPSWLTYDGTNYVLLWKDEGSEGGGNLNTVFCTRVSPDGVVLDPQGIKIVSDTTSIGGLHISPGPTDLSLIVGSNFVSQAPYSSPRLWGTFFWGDSTPNYPPEPFSLLSPADGDTVIRPACFDWEEAPDPNPEDHVYYDLYVSPTTSFEPDSTIIVDSITNSGCILGNLEYGIPYYWKVKAYDRWSSIWSQEIWSLDLENYGDANADGTVDVGDVIYLINYLFRNGTPPNPLASGDENGDCQVDVGDVLYLINYLFRGGSPPQPGCA